MKKYKVLILIMLLISYSGYSQDECKLLKDISIGINYGVTKFHGDVSMYKIYPSYSQDYSQFSGSQAFHELKSYKKIGLIKEIDDKTFLEMDFVFGKVAGLDRYSKITTSSGDIDDPSNNFNSLPGERFNANFYELDFVVGYEILNLFNMNSSRYNLYAEIGLGYNLFNSEKLNLNNESYIYSVGYTDQESGGGETIFGLMENTLAYIGGVDFQYVLNSNSAFSLQYTLRQLSVDYFDVSERGDGNDNFSSLSLGYIYSFNSDSKERRYKELIDNNIEQLGLKKDSDNDGVSDLFDKEKNTPPNTVVDGAGKEIHFQQHISSISNNTNEESADKSPIINVWLSSIYFNSGSSLIDRDNEKRIAAIALVLKDNPEITIELIGNTDSIGKEEDNLKLGHDRSSSVKNMLVEKFLISKERISILSRGEASLLAPDLMNVDRRVDVVVK